MAPPLSRPCLTLKRFLVFAGAGLGLCFLAAGSPPSSGLEEAGALIRRAQYPAAVSLLIPATAPDLPDSSEARLMLGYCLYQQDNYKEAASACNQAAENGGRLEPYARYYAGVSFLAQADYAEAGRQFDRLLLLNPSASLLPRALYASARCRVELRQSAEALQALDILAQVPGRPPGWEADLLWWRAWALDQSGAPDQARPLLRRVWVEFPQTRAATQAEALIFGPEAGRFTGADGSPLLKEQDRLERVDHLLEAGEFSRALRELEPFLDRVEKTSWPPEAEAALRWKRAKALSGLRRLSAAIIEFERIFNLSREKDVEAAFQVGRLYDRQDKKRQALAAYQRVWTSFPHREQARWSLFHAGRMHQMDQEHAEAGRLFQRLVNSYPGIEPADEALFHLGWMHYLDHEYSEASTYLERMGERPEDPSFNARSLFWRARTLDHLERTEEAHQLRRRLLERYPGSGYTYLARHFPDTAMVPWLPPADGNPAGPEPQSPLDLSLAEKLIALGLKPEVREELGWFESRDPESPAAAIQISRAYLAGEDYFFSQRRIQQSFPARLANYHPEDRGLWELAYPLAYGNEVFAQASRSSLDPRLILALIRAESTYRPEIRSRAGAVGLMQIMPATGRKISRDLGEKDYRVQRLQEPDLNIRFGCYYLRQLLLRYQTGGNSPAVPDLVFALAAYNAGESRVDEWRLRFARFNLGPDEFIEQIPFQETRNYVKRVLGFYQIYSLLYPQL